jgi:hypothetical protein
MPKCLLPLLFSISPRRLKALLAPLPMATTQVQMVTEPPEPHEQMLASPRHSDMPLAPARPELEMPPRATTREAAAALSSFDLPSRMAPILAYDVATFNPTFGAPALHEDANS